MTHADALMISRAIIIVGMMLWDIERDGWPFIAAAIAAIIFTVAA